MFVWYSTGPAIHFIGTGAIFIFYKQGHLFLFSGSWCCTCRSYHEKRSHLVRHYEGSVVSDVLMHFIEARTRAVVAFTRCVCNSVKISRKGRDVYSTAPVCHETQSSWRCTFVVRNFVSSSPVVCHEGDLTSFFFFTAAYAWLAVQPMATNEWQQEQATANINYCVTGSSILSVCSGGLQSQFLRT